MPVFCFGENKLYKRIKWLENLLEKYVFNRYPAFRRISYMLNYGCGLLLPIGILPFRNAIDVVGNYSFIPNLKRYRIDKVL